MSFLTRSCAGVWYVWGRVLGGPASQSCCPIAEVQAIPPATATCPSPSLRALGEGEGQMALEGQAASWVQHPPHPQPQSYLPGPTSTLWTPPPLPQSKPLSPSARQCCMTGQTQSFTKINPLSLLCSCLGLQEKLNQSLKEPSSLLAKQHSWDFHYHKVPEPATQADSLLVNWTFLKERGWHLLEQHSILG